MSGQDEAPRGDPGLLKYSALVLAIGALVWQAGIMWGGSRSETIETSKILAAMAERDSRQDEMIKGLEHLAADNASAIGNLIERLSGYVETRQLIVQESTRDRSQLNSRVASLEGDRIAAARLEQRLKTIEALLRDRLPVDQGR